MNRPTATAHFWTETGNEGVLAPCDLARSEHGTWIGVSNTGKFAALLNVHQEDSEMAAGQISRGKFPKDFLSSSDYTSDWLKYTREFYGDALERTGGFTLVCGEITPKGTAMHTFSNRSDKDVELFKDGQSTICLSNASDHKLWPKVELGKRLLEETVNTAVKENWSEDVLIDHLFEILSTNTYPENSTDKIYDLRKSIFIPKLDVDSGFGKFYGTRTQTLVLANRDGVIRYIEKDVITGIKEELEVGINI